MINQSDGGFKRQRGRPKKNVHFNPDHKFINAATQNFIKKGGTIKKLKDAGDLSNNQYHSSYYQFENPLIMDKIYLS